MTEVEFHTGVVDPVGFACRLLRKAVRRGVRVRVIAPEDTLGALDRALWTFDERDFIPHVRVPGASAETAARTPIWLVPAVDATVGDSPAPAVLLNLGAEAPDLLAGLDRLIREAFKPSAVLVPVRAIVPACRCSGRCHCATLVPVLLHRQIELECTSR